MRRAIDEPSRAPPSGVAISGLRDQGAKGITAFLEVAKRIDEYASRRPMPFFLWVRLITGQKLVAAHRHHLGTLKRDAARDYSVQAFPVASTITMAHALVDPASSPSSALQKAEVRDRLRTALDALDPEDREVLALLYFEKLSNDEAAHALGLSYSGVRKRRNARWPHHVDLAWDPVHAPGDPGRTPEAAAG